MYCGKCGSTVPEGYEFCMKCGTKIDTTTDNSISGCPKTEVVHKQKISKKKLIIILSTVGVLILASILIFVFTSANSLHIPNSLNLYTQEILSSDSQEVLDASMKALVTAYNTRSDNQILNKTKEFESAYSALGEQVSITTGKEKLALQMCQSTIFCIIMSESTGMDFDSSHELVPMSVDEVAENAKNSIQVLIDEYYKK